MAKKRYPGKKWKYETEVETQKTVNATDMSASAGGGAGRKDPGRRGPPPARGEGREDRRSIRPGAGRKDAQRWPRGSLLPRLGEKAGGVYARTSWNAT